MKATKTIFVLVCIGILMSSCKVMTAIFRPKDLLKAEDVNKDYVKKAEVPDPVKAGQDYVDRNLNDILKQKLGIKIRDQDVKRTYDIPVDPNYVKWDINPEVAPYLVGTIIQRNMKTGHLAPTTFHPILAKTEDVRTSMQFSKPEISMFIDKETRGSIGGVVGDADFDKSKKVNITYNRIFSGVHANVPWDKTAFDKDVFTYGLGEKDSLYVVIAAEVKMFTYSLYTQFKGEASVTPVPIVSIAGSLFQGSGKEQNVYEVYVLLAKVYYPVKEVKGGKKTSFEIDVNSAPQKTGTNYKLADDKNNFQHYSNLKNRK